MTDFTMTIDGQPVAAEQTFGVVNPATGEVFAEAPECSQDQLEAAMSSAAKAYMW
jgi:acyl-CoA reductase-like NAD-dependent aldehyde dehydrogenase